MGTSNEEERRVRLLQLRGELESVAETGDKSAETVELDQSRVGRLRRAWVAYPEWMRCRLRPWPRNRGDVGIRRCAT